MRLCAMLAVMLAVFDGAGIVEQIAAVFLWAVAGLLAAIKAGILIATLVYDKTSANPWLRGPPDHADPPVFGVHDLIGVILWSALFASGRPFLAGLFFFFHLAGTAVKVHARSHRDGFLASDVDAVSWTIFVLLRWATRFIWSCWMLPFTIAGMLWRRTTEWRLSHRLCAEFGAPDGLIYFLHAEPHQLDHFLGEGGVLSPFRDHVVVRSWRKDLTPVQQAVGWTRFHRTPEGGLLRRYAVSNLRNHLPFMVVVGADGRLHPYRFNEAYRARRHDKGMALCDLENKIKDRIADAFAADAT